MCCLSSPEGSRSGKATAQMTCQQETLYSDNRRGAAQVQHITYAIVSPVRPPGKQAVAIKIYHLFQATKNNLLPQLSIWAVSCGCRVWVFLAWYKPLERTFLSRIHELFCLFENSQENIPIAYRGSWVPPCSTYYTPRRRL